jgi:hypothetical protein
MVRLCDLRKKSLAALFILQASAKEAKQSEAEQNARQRSSSNKQQR